MRDGDREMLAELARLNSDVTPLAMRLMADVATADEQHDFARRLISMATQLQARATKPWVIEGDADEDDGETGTATYPER